MKRKVIIISIVIFIVILLSVGTYFIIKSRPKKESDKDLAESDVPPVYDGAPVANISTYSSASFPIKKGMRGEMVANVQRYLGSNAACVSSYKINGASIPTADGVFGPITEKALKSCKGVNTVSQELYNQMIAPPPAAAPSATAIKKSDKIYLSGDQSMLFTFPENKAQYFLGRVSKTLFLDKSFGIFIEDAANGMAKITVIGYEPYNKTTGGYDAFKAQSTTAYIFKSNIRKTAY